jgi:PAS domain S-box-containing protein
MQHPWPFTRRIAVGLMASLGVALVIAATAGLAVRAVASVDEEVRTAHRARDLLEVERLRRTFHEKLVSQRSHVLTEEPSFAVEARLARQRFLDSLARLQSHALSPTEEALLDDVLLAERAHEDAMQGLLGELAGESSPSSRLQRDALFRERVGPASEHALRTMSRLVSFSEQQLMEGAERAVRLDRQALWLIPASATLGLLVALALAWVLARMLRPLHRHAEASEESLRLLVDGARDYALFLLDPKGQVASWNVGAERISGWKASEILGCSLDRFYPPEEAGLPAAELTQAQREGRVQVEGWRLRKDGSRFWAECVVTALRGEHGQLKGYSVLTRDMTERKKVEHAQRLFAEAESLFHGHKEPDDAVTELARLTVPALADGCLLFLVGKQGTLEPRAVAHVSAEKEALLRELVRMPLPTDHPNGLMEVLRTGRSLRVGEVTPSLLEREARNAEDLALMRRLGSKAYLLVPLRAGERTVGVLGVLSQRAELRFSDTDQVFLEELAARAALALENARLLRETQAALDLLGVASHDLGNPLNALQLQLSRLRRSPPEDSEQLREGLGSALRHTQRLGRLLHNLLDLSRLSSGRMELELAEIDMAELVREAAERHAEQAHEVGSSLELHLETGVVGRWDRLRLERVLTNLLSNAFKHGQGKPIEVQVRRVDGHVRLQVCDHGPGIVQEEQPFIFERFHKRGTRGERKEGFGLGLYIVRQLVEAHGGSIRVHSVPGQGATFIVELPLVPVFQEVDAGARHSSTVH